MEGIGAKLRQSAVLYRQRLAEIEGQRKRIKLLPAEDTVVLVKGGKRLRVQSQAKLELRKESCAKMEVIKESHEIMDLVKVSEAGKDIIAVSSEDEEETKPICTYPKGRGAISLYPADLDRLQEGRFLNDQIINMLLKWSYNNTLRKENKNRTHVYDTFLYAGLMAGINQRDLIEATEETNRIEKNIQRILRNPVEAEGLKKNLVLIPICEDSHWLLVVLVNEGTTVTLLLLDSLAHHPRDNVIRACQRLVTRASAVQRCITVKGKVVQQQNGYDCGVHLLHNADMILQHTNDHPRSELKVVEEYLGRPMFTRKDLRRKILEINTYTSTLPSPITQQLQILSPSPTIRQQSPIKMEPPPITQQIQIIPPSPTITQQAPTTIKLSPVKLQIIPQPQQQDKSPKVLQPGEGYDIQLDMHVMNRQIHT